MNRQERARVIASLTHDEIKQLRDRVSDAASDAPNDAELRFARRLFDGGSDDPQDDQDDDDDKQDDDQRAVEKCFLSMLFADTDEDPIIAGLVAGKTVGRTTP